MIEIEQDTEIITDLRAVVVYLHAVGAVYPIAPEQAIKTIERIIDDLSSKEIHNGRNE